MKIIKLRAQNLKSQEACKSTLCLSQPDEPISVSESVSAETPATIPELDVSALNNISSDCDNNENNSKLINKF